MSRKKGSKLTEKHKEKIRQSNKKTWSNPELRKRVSVDRLGDMNTSKKPEVKAKIKNTVKKRWQEGLYRKRINGSTLKRAGYEHDYRKYISRFQNVNECYYCKKKATMIHHIDETHENWLPTNLIPICDSCHQRVHRWVKTPFITLAKEFSFCSAHHLIEYSGKCQFGHGHQYFIKIFVRQRINPITGLVIDYGDIKSIYKKYIDDVIDHKDLNKVTDVKKTSAENLLLWLWKQFEEKALLKGLVKIELKETDTSYAIITDKDMLEYRQDEKDWLPQRYED